ncbi:hypothetical protein Btru_043587 [Bulinus truncatus]|nr:hypothetical protein Btru_043587 [Bulinus truncatus]
MDATSSFLIFALSVIPSGVALSSDFNPKSQKHPLDLIIDPCVSQFTAQELTINCSWRGLNTVNNSWFPTGSKVILLFHNSITVIENTTFQGLSQLRVLDLTSNRISSIGSYAFIDLIKLESLYLEDNDLSLFNLPATVFCPLVNLFDLHLRYQQFSAHQECIMIKQNKDENSPIYYPSNMFGCLYNLINLTIDTLGGNLYFDEQFNNLTKLTHLGLNCDVDFITNTTFANVPHVRYLSFTNALLIRSFDDMAIAPLTELDYLSFAYVSTGLHASLAPLAGHKIFNAMKDSSDTKVTQQKIDSLKPLDLYSYSEYFEIQDINIDEIPEERDIFKLRKALKVFAYPTSTLLLYRIYMFMYINSLQQSSNINS